MGTREPASHRRRCRRLGTRVAGRGGSPVEVFPDIRLSRSIHPGPAGQALVAMSEHAELLVAGATGAGTVKSLVTGSTVMRVVNHGHCAVTVFRSRSRSPVPDHSPVIVGVDGSELSALAIESAVGFATLFEVPILAANPS